MTSAISRKNVRKYTSDKSLNGSWKFKILEWVIIPAVSLFIGWLLGVNKDDIKGVIRNNNTEILNGIDSTVINNNPNIINPIDSSMHNVSNEATSNITSVLRQELSKINNNDMYYALRKYENLYKQLLDSFFPFGYATFQVNGNNIINLGNSSDESTFRISGRVNFVENDVNYEIEQLGSVYLSGKSRISNNTITGTIENYKIGIPYILNSFTIDQRSDYVIFISDSKDSPVFVYGYR